MKIKLAALITLFASLGASGAMAANTNEKLLRCDAKCMCGNIVVPYTANEGIEIMNAFCSGVTLDVIAANVAGGTTTVDQVRMQVCSNYPGLPICQ